MFRLRQAFVVAPRTQALGLVYRALGAITRSNDCSDVVGKIQQMLQWGIETKKLKAGKVRATGILDDATEAALNVATMGRWPSWSDEQTFQQVRTLYGFPPVNSFSCKSPMSLLRTHITPTRIALSVAAISLIVLATKRMNKGKKAAQVAAPTLAAAE